MELYGTAANILARVAQRRGSARNLCLDPRVEQKRVVFKLVHETLRNAKQLDQCLKAAGCDQLLLEATAAAPNAALARAAARLFAYELLIGQGLHRRPGRTSPEVKAAMSTIVKRKAELKDAFARVGPAVAPPAVPKLPRYVRVNVLKASVEEVEAHLVRAHPTLHRDAHVPALLVLPPSTDLHDDALVRAGKAILQDKASCMPVVALRARAGWRCIDACAAPGNKTSQLAAAVGAHGRVDAFERDGKRAALLRRRIGEAGAAEIVAVHHADFLASSPADFSRVDALLCDPSCSGSGMVGRAADAPDADADDADADAAAARATERIAALGAMQEKILSHALSFPSARVVVYSTCSVHAVENEAVVAAALVAAAPRGWRLADALPGWHRRGLAADGVALDAAQCALLVRCLPEDGCGGFFVARFERLDAAGAAPAAAAGRAPRAAGRARSGVRTALYAGIRVQCAVASGARLRLQGVLARATAR
jgi:putative methyltransferase